MKTMPFEFVLIALEVEIFSALGKRNSASVSEAIFGTASSGAILCRSKDVCMCVVWWQGTLLLSYGANNGHAEEPVHSNRTSGELNIDVGVERNTVVIIINAT